jgi:hypothetical protein
MRRFVTPAVILAVGAVILLLIEYWSHVRNEFFVLLGSRNEAGGYYGLWSGFGGALPDVLIFTAMAGWYWHKTCHISRCWRPGRHLVDGSPWCGRHHIAARQKLAATGSAHDLGGQS